MLRKVGAALSPSELNALRRLNMASLTICPGSPGPADLMALVGVSGGEHLARGIDAAETDQACANGWRAVPGLWWPRS